MSTLPILRAEAAQAAAQLRSAKMSDRTPWSQMPALEARAAATARTLELAEGAVKAEMTGLLEAVGGMRWDAEQAECHVRAGTLREVEDLVKGALS